MEIGDIEVFDPIGVLERELGDKTLLRRDYYRNLKDSLIGF